MARKLLSMPASSATIERIFSNIGLIQTTLGNKLGIQKCAKLVSILLPNAQRKGESRVVNVLINCCGLQ